MTNYYVFQTAVFLFLFWWGGAFRAALRGLGIWSGRPSLEPAAQGIEPETYRMADRDDTPGLQAPLTVCHFFFICSRLAAVQRFRPVCFLWFWSGFVELVGVCVLLYFHFSSFLYCFLSFFLSFIFYFSFFSFLFLPSGLYLLSFLSFLLFNLYLLSTFFFGGGGELCFCFVGVFVSMFFSVFVFLFFSAFWFIFFVFFPIHFIFDCFCRYLWRVMRWILCYLNSSHGWAGFLNHIFFVP